MRHQDFAGTTVRPPGRGSSGGKNRFPMTMGTKEGHCQLPEVLMEDTQ